MTKKAELVKDAESLGIDTEGLKVAELEAAIQEALDADAKDEEAPVEKSAPAAMGPNAAHAVGDEEGVHLKLGHMEADADGNMGFHEDGEFVLSRDAALALGDELPGAAADHNAVGSHFG